MIMNAAAFTCDVFLSHSAKDTAVVRPLAERLRQDGLKVSSHFGFRISDLRSPACRRMRSARIPTGRDWRPARSGFGRTGGDEAIALPWAKR